MRKVIRDYTKDKNLNLILIGTIPFPHSKDKRSPVARQDKRYLVRQEATIFKRAKQLEAQAKLPDAKAPAASPRWPRVVLLRLGR